MAQWKFSQNQMVAEETHCWYVNRYTDTQQNGGHLLADTLLTAHVYCYATVLAFAVETYRIERGKFSYSARKEINIDSVVTLGIQLKNQPAIAGPWVQGNLLKQRAQGLEDLTSTDVLQHENTKLRILAAPSNFYAWQKRKS